VKFDESALDRLTGDSDERLPVPEFLRAYGVLEVKTAFRHDGRSFSPLERRYGFHRLYRLRVPIEFDAPSLARELAAEPLIEYAHPNHLGRAGQVAPDDTYFASDQWNLDNTGQTGGTPDADIDAAEAWLTAVGRRETLIGVIDGGIDGDHREFRGLVARHGIDTMDGDWDPENPGSHGTSVSGFIGATANNRFSVAGVNWRAGLMPVRVGGPTEFPVLGLVDGIRHAANQGVDITNISLDYPDSPTLADAVSYADWPSPDLTPPQFSRI
jgi:subtilisin family serine protease